MGHGAFHKGLDALPKNENQIRDGRGVSLGHRDEFITGRPLHDESTHRKCLSFLKDLSSDLIRNDCGECCARSSSFMFKKLDHIAIVVRDTEKAAFIEPGLTHGVLWEMTEV